VGPKIAIEMLASCSGCEISLLDMDEKILEILKLCELVYCPVLLDTKKPPKVDVSIISGCIRNEQDREKALLMRRNSSIIIALGSCACFGGIPGLANLFKKEEILKEVYIKYAENEKKTIPKTPALERRVYALDQVIDVDVKIPGCPPPTKIIKKALISLLRGEKHELKKKTVCDECERKMEEKKIKDLKRVYQKSSEKCLLEQGFLCMGPATRAGCEAVCPNVGIGCEGCTGPPDLVKDQGSKMISTLASLIENPEVLKRDDTFVGDVLGSFYRFTLPRSIIQVKK
jgi:F420-non-reducing hydrogenase small subunit